MCARVRDEKSACRKVRERKKERKVSRRKRERERERKKQTNYLLKV